MCVCVCEREFEGVKEWGKFLISERKIIVSQKPNVYALQEEKYNSSQRKNTVCKTA